jgi:hypothetical protein
MDTEFLTPEWKATAPDTLERVIEKYKVAGAALAELGYTIAADDMDATFWFQRVWTEDQEQRFVPWKIDQKANGDKPWVPVLDADRTVTHGLGFVPVVWIKNLPGGAGVDGFCTFGPAINDQIEIDYQLSQAGRGLRYSSDPLLVIREPAGTEKNFVRNAANAMKVDSSGDAKLLEIDGSAANAVISYVKALRELALESVHGNRSTPDKAANAQSGRALELLHEPLIWLAGRLRASYGAALLALTRMVMRAADTMDVRINGAKASFPDGTDVSLRWGHWFHPTFHDMLEGAQGLATHATAGHISRESAVMIVCDTYDLPDAAAEKLLIEADMKEADARAARLAAVAKTTVAVGDKLNT